MNDGVIKYDKVAWDNRFEVPFHVTPAQNRELAQIQCRRSVSKLSGEMTQLQHQQYFERMYDSLMEKQHEQSYRYVHQRAQPSPARQPHRRHNSEQNPDRAPTPPKPAPTCENTFRVKGQKNYRTRQ